MKTSMLVLMLLCSLPLHAACKCTCVSTDRNICASGYDLENPCPSLCKGQASMVAPGRLPCPPIVVVNPITGIKEWDTNCTQ